MLRFQKLIEDYLASGNTARQLAKDVGVSEGAISKYRKGERKPGLYTINRFAKVFGMNGIELLDIIIDDYHKED